jgi:hypothetical protein
MALPMHLHQSVASMDNRRAVLTGRRAKAKFRTLYSCINCRRRKVKVRADPTYLDGMLTERTTSATVSNPAMRAVFAAFRTNVPMWPAVTSATT